jgi:Phage integrase, N-terminal SAM-like domain
MGVKVKPWKGAWGIFICHKAKRKAKRVTSRAVALRVAQEVQARLALGDTKFLERDGKNVPLPTLSGYAGSWLKQHEMKPSTAGFYGQFLRLYVLPKFGECRLDEITRPKVKEWVSELSG